MKKLFNNIKYIKWRDLIAPIILIFVLPLAIIYKIILKISKKEIWLICESPDTARDNGYWLFKYIRENYPNSATYYAIKKNAVDLKRVERLGNVIYYGSLKHWIYYLVAQKNISSQKAGNPSAPLFYVLQVYGILKNDRYFLQHGIIKDDLDWLYYKNTKFKLFVCGAKPEYQYVKQKFGYPEKSVQYLGLARFDNLHNFKTNKKQILVMPTWRNWLGRETNMLNGKKTNFTDTKYCKSWSSFFNNEKLIKYIENNDIKVYFYPHFNMQKYINEFTKNSRNIIFVDRNSYEIQKLLKESSLLITDYSSVFMDFAYMKKPIIYYQFDKEEYRQKQYKEGYFSYEKDGFGVVLEKEEEVINKTIEYIEDQFRVEEEYKNRMNNFFELYDTKNCERIYEAIKKY